MKEKLKTLTLAFSGLIVYSALTIVIPTFVDNVCYVRLIAGIIFVILGSIYTSTVIKETGHIIDITRGFFITALVAVLIYCFTSLFTSNLILKTIVDDGFMEQATAKASLTPDLVILSTVMSICLSPIAEELIYRGFMYRFLSQFNKPMAMIVSSVIFAIGHGTIVHLYAAFFGGLIFVCIYDKTHKLRYSMLAHILFNGMTVLLGLFKYPDFMLEPWWCITLNLLTFIAIVALFKTPSAKVIPKIELTEEQKKYREETSRIVQDVLDEYKTRR